MIQQNRENLTLPREGKEGFQEVVILQVSSASSVVAHQKPQEKNIPGRVNSCGKALFPCWISGQVFVIVHLGV